MPSVPSLPQLQLPVRNLVLAAAITAGGIWALGLILPRTPAYRTLVSSSASGALTDQLRDRRQSTRIGLEGHAVSVLRPGGKAQFGDDILDVVTTGEFLERGTRVRIVAHSGHEAIVEAAG